LRERAGVRASLIQSHPNTLQHPLCVYEHVVVPEPDHSITESLQKAAALFVPILPLGMLAAIQLDDQHWIQAQEVRDVASNNLLASELAAFELTIPQSAP
jgi:hypothetical protein